MIGKVKAFRLEELVLFLIGLSCLINFRNLFLPLIDGDSSLYAEVAREVFRNRDFLHLTQQGQPFLDKPHMFFWLSAISYSVFGVNSFAFKFPSFLALLGTLFSVYKLAKQYYSKTIALYASLITASALGVFLMTNDVRMEMLLTCFIITGIWQLSNYLIHGKIKALLLSVICFCSGYYTKGAIGFIIPAVAIFPQMIKRKGKVYVLKTSVLLLALLIVFLLPLFIISYYQFGWEGVRYFAWGHIADRVSGKVASNNPDTFFVFHTMLWVLAPWTLFLLAGIWITIKTVLIPPEEEGREIICISGLLLGLLALSFSSFQQSYYVYPLIPFAAIIAASNSALFWRNRFFIGIQTLVNVVAILLSALITFYVTPGAIIYVVAFFILVLGFVYASKKESITIATAAAAIVLNFVLSFIFFPAILTFQPNAELSAFASDKHLSSQNFVSLNVGSPYQFLFYSEFSPKAYFDVSGLMQEKRRTPFYVVTDQRGFDDMTKTHINLSVEKRLNNFHLTKLNLDFLNPKTRDAACDKWYLLQVKE
jgi:4-amino-4-deoxy-L-arabinose transferase-like glycosyltransferase